MKQLLLTFSALVAFFTMQSQDTLANNVYQKVQQLRFNKNLDSLIVDEPLELAASQHGCWLALYNAIVDTNKILLPEIEYKNGLVEPLKTPEHRVRNYTDRNFTTAKQYCSVFYKQPTSDLVFETMKDSKLLYDKKYKYQGFWIIKYEDKQGEPLWYLVFTLTD
jgi:hypothetical protein